MPETLTLITGGTLVTPSKVHPHGAVLVAGTRIRAAGAEGSFDVPREAQVVDAGGGRIIPGLIDVHIHGLEGHAAAGPGLADVIRALPAHGVTAFLPTSYDAARVDLCEALAQMRPLVEQPPIGAKPLGIHMEGPWLSPKHPGAGNPARFYPLTEGDVIDFQDASGGRVRMVTFAPEEGDALNVIPWLVEHGIIPTLGHSDADYDTVHRAVALGLNHATHTYNAMRGLHHRDPGTLGAVLDHDEIVAQLIADGHHVHPAAMRILIRAKGVERVCLVSDATPPAGLPPGRVEWEGRTLVGDGQTVRLEDGTLAGSATLLDGMLRVLVEQAGVDFKDAVRMATDVPARLLSVYKGRLQPGYDADITVLDDDYHPRLTMVGGQIVYRAD